MNNRAPRMWEQITEHVDFNDKSVVDLGCGTGDFLFRSIKSGASSVVGYDIDELTAREATRNCKKEGCVVHVSVQDVSTLSDDVQYDIGIFFSVLPYVANPVKVLDWMSRNVEISLIECQYSGDGPGPKNLYDDLDMKNFLNLFWDDIEVIGRTKLKIRDAKRTIWKCVRS